MQIHVLMSLIIVTMEVWRVTVMSPQFPHPFFPHIYQDNFHNSVRLAILTS